MTNTTRPYSDAADLDRMKKVLIEGRRASRHSGYMHVGDLDWALFYDADNKRREDSIRLWSRADGPIVGYGRRQGSVYFEHHLLPGLRGTPLQQEIIACCEDAVRASAQKALEDGSVCATEIFEDDAATAVALTQRGYLLSKVSGLYFARELDRGVPATSLPPGFLVRGMSDADIEQRAAVHFAAFSPGSRMTAAYYRAFMSAPGYDPALDSVVEAPDGRIAAYAMAWLDPDNRLGEFEPVGTHPDFRRLGLARAALYRGLGLMRERGMATAIVYTNAENVAARALYPAAGFTLTNRFVTYARKGWSQA